MITDEIDGFASIVEQHFVSLRPLYGYYRRDFIVRRWLTNYASDYKFYPKNNLNKYMWNGVLQPSCKIVTTLQGCECLAQNAITLLQPYKVVARLLQNRNFRMGIMNLFCFSNSVVMPRTALEGHF